MATMVHPYTGRSKKDAGKVTEVDFVNFYKDRKGKTG